MAEEVKRIRAVFEADISGYNTSLDSLNKQMKLARSETKLAQKEMEGFGTSSESVAKVQEKMNQQIEIAKKKIELYSQSLSKSQSTIDTNVKSREKLSKAVEEAQKALTEAEKAHGKESEAAKKASEALDEAKNAYDKNEAAIKNNIKRVAEYETQITNAKTEITGLENAMASQNQKLQEQTNQFKRASEALDKFGDKAKTVGDSISRASDKVLGISAAMGAVIGTSSALSMSFEKDIANINTLLDDTTNLDKYKNKVLDMSNQTGIALETVSAGMYQTISSIGDLGDETTQIFETMTKSAKAGEAEVSDAVSLISSAMKGYGQINDETAKKISDLAFQTAKLGVTTFPEMASSMQDLFPKASSLSISLEELYGNMATLTGVTGNTAAVSTQLKAVFDNLMKPTTEMEKLIAKYGYSNAQAMLETEGFANMLYILKEETGGASDKLGELFSSSEALTAIIALTGEQYDTFIDKTKQMEEAAGATNTALNKIESTKSDKLAKSLNGLKNSFIDLGDTAAPLVDKFTSSVDKLADTIRDMDEDTLQGIVSMTGMGIAVGATGKVVGGTISTVGSLSKGLSTVVGWFGKTSGAATAVGTATSAAAGASGMGALVSSLGAVVSVAGPCVLAGAAIVGTGAAIYKGMTQEVVPSVDLFADSLTQTGTVMTQYGEVATYTSQKISEETQKQVQAYLDLDEQAKFALMDLYYNSQEITDNTVNSMTEKYKLMGETITTGLAENKEKDTEILSQFFETSTLMTEEQEAETLRLMQEGYANKETTVIEAQARIYEILETAKNETRELKEEEVKEISELQEQLRTTAINTLSTQEAEAQVILDRMSAYDQRVTAEMVSEHIKKLNEQEQAAIDSANAQYREVVSTIENMRDDLGVITAEQAEAMIKDAERQRDETIKAAGQTRDGAVEKIFSMNKDLRESVDSTTGDILTWWDKLKNWWNNWFPSKKKFETETVNKTTNITTNKQRSVSRDVSDSSLYNALNANVSRQIQTAMLANLNVASRAQQQLYRTNQSNINVTPKFEGAIEIYLDGEKYMTKNVRFIDKSLGKRKDTLSYGGIG